MQGIFVSKFLEIGSWTHTTPKPTIIDVGEYSELRVGRFISEHHNDSLMLLCYVFLTNAVRIFGFPHPPHVIAWV